MTLPAEHMHQLLKSIRPRLRWDGKEDAADWQKRARTRLSELLGLSEIAKRRCEPNIKIEYDRYMADLGAREIRFLLQTERDVWLPCHLCIPRNVNHPMPTVIAMQGHSTGVHISMGRAKFPGDEVDCRDSDFVRRAVKEGWCGVAVEQRCFGSNGGDPVTGMPNCRQTAMRALLLGRTLIGERVWDIMRLIDALQEQFDQYVDTHSIICLGNSGGGTATLYASAVDERIKIAVPSCAVCRFEDSIGAMKHCECNYIPGISKEFDMGDLCAMVAPRPLVVVSGEKDEIFPIAGAKACVLNAKRMYAAMEVPKNLVHVIGDGGHKFYPDAAWKQIHAAAKRSKI